MNTFPKIIGFILLVALTAVAQRARELSATTAWSTIPASSTGLPAAAPTTRQVQLRAILPNVIPPAAGEAGKFNSLVTYTTAGPVNLGPGDLLEIGVFDSPELTTRDRVSSEGEITFPLLGKLHVGGMTPQAVQDLIRRQLVAKDLVKAPQVAVFVAEYANQAVYILGEVTKPGAYPIMGSHRLFDFISAAGGFTLRAGKSIKITRHAAPNATETVHFSRDPNFAAGNPEISAGDTVYVKQAGVVYVVGDVIKPGGFLMDSDEHMTVMQAVAIAEGTKPTAALGNAQLIRKTDQGREEVAVNLKKVFQLKAPDPVMHDQDILYVPSSALKTGLDRSMGTALGAAIGAAIYRF